MENALVLKSLEKTYAAQNGQGSVQALKSVSLTVPAGDFFALLGPNGAGKSTIIGIITGLVNKTGGTLEVFGVDIDKHPEKARTFVGVVPQNLNFNIFERVIDIVVNQAGYYGIPRSVAIPRADEILKGVGLYEKRNDASRTLSGGMMRRLMIARALIHDPKFLVLDEPTAGVDVELRRSMWEYLTGLTKRGVTILLTTHYLEEAEQLAKNVAIINKGEIVVQGPMAELLATHDDSSATKGPFRGGKLEEIFLKLTQS
jgi:ABC-2 type transport system ATP-binding protein